MDVSAIVTRLTAQTSSFAQIVAASPGGTVAPVDTQANLYTLLQSVVSGRMYPVQAPEQATTPHLVYQLVGSEPGVLEGYDLTHTDTYVLNLRGPDYDTLRTLYGSIVSALSGENIEIEDASHDFDQSEGLYRINCALTYSYIASGTQTLPAAFVYPLSRSAGDNLYDNSTKQLVSADYAIVVITDDGTMPTLLGEIQDALLGWTQGAEYHEMLYGSGANIEAVGDLEVWREVYRDAYYMTQA